MRKTELTINEYDGLRGYLGNQKLEAVDLNGRRYLIRVKMQIDERGRELTIVRAAYKVVSSNKDSNAVKAVEIIDEKLIRALRNTYDRELKESESDLEEKLETEDRPLEED